MQYTDMFKNAMIQKMTGPGAMSASALSEQVEVPQPTLSKWLRMAGVDSSYGFPNNVHEYSKMTKIKGPKRPNDRSAEDKLKVVMEAAALDEEQLGAFLREKSLHLTHLEQWRMQMLDGLQNGSSKKMIPNASAPWKRSCVERTRPWQKPRCCWCSKKKSKRSGGTRTIPQPGATENDHRAY